MSYGPECTSVVSLRTPVFLSNAVVALSALCFILQLQDLLLRLCGESCFTTTTTTTTMSSSFQLQLQRSSTVLCRACRHAFPPAVVLCPSLECRWRCQSRIPFLCYPYLVPTAQGWKQSLLGAWHNFLYFIILRKVCSFVSYWAVICYL